MLQAQLPVCKHDLVARSLICMNRACARHDRQFFLLNCIQRCFLRLSTVKNVPVNYAFRFSPPQPVRHVGARCWGGLDVHHVTRKFEEPTGGAQLTTILDNKIDGLGVGGFFGWGGCTVWGFAP